MPAFCDVALPVPLDQTFTYSLNGVVPAVGARVLVPFSGQRLMGVVIRLHDNPLPEGVETKPIQQVLDSDSLLSPELMRLAGWIAQYYVAPLGEVLRGMLPLAAEVKRHYVYRIAGPGRKVLYQGAEKGSSRRSRLSPDDQNKEYAVLNYLEDGQPAKASALRSATQANKALLDGMVRKKWLLREAQAEERDARRTERFAVLVPDTRLPKLNANQTTLLAELAAVGGRMRTRDLRNLNLPDSTLGTLVKRGLVIIEELAEDFHIASNQPEGKLSAHEHPLNESQLEALSIIAIALNHDDKSTRDPPQPQKCHPERSAAESKDLLLSSLPPPQNLQSPDLNQPQKCHPERSAAESKDLLLSSLPQPQNLQSPDLNQPQKCHPERSAAESKDLLLSSLPQPQNLQSPDLNQPQKCHPERSAAESKDLLLSSLPQPQNLQSPDLNQPQKCHPERSAAESKDLLLSSQPTNPPTGFRAHLLYGITGSGKTAVYFAAMQRVLDSGKSSLLLVPEIGLTPAMAGQMYAAFGNNVALLHSQLTPDERAEQWHRIRRGEAKIVVGTRSAVFAPIENLGLIIVDEEHDSSYKQEETPRYNGRDVAVMRAKLLEIPVVLGSATPSLESWSNAANGRYTLIEMRQRVANRPLPTVELVDMRIEFQQTGQENIFSRRLLEETQATLDRGEQAIILLNRRGYSFVVLCRSCGEKIQCENCSISMTYHKEPYHKQSAEDPSIASPGTRLQCHYCGFRRNVPKNCPACQSEHLYFLGAGSQQGEERLQELFPNARIGRMDRDTVRGRMDMERLLARLHAGEINLLVGTQMIAKGHDIHGVTLVGVVGADFALGLPDFRAAERTFQLLTQVSGRAGRGNLPGKVLVQTYHPDHYAIQFAAAHDYPGFVAKELQYRRWMHYPPFAVLANIIIQSPKLEEATAWSAELGRWFQKTPLDKIRVLGPAAAPIVRLKRIYRYHFVLKAEQRNSLGKTLRAMLTFADTHEIPRRNILVDVDAVHLM